MDPVSLAASIAGLISLADVVFRSVYKYGKAVSGAKQEVSELSQEINNLSSLLRVLDAQVIDLEDSGDKFNTALGSHLLGNCRDTLEKIRAKVQRATDSFQSRSKLGGATRQLKWPFAASETKELMAAISRYKETMTLAVSSDSMRQLQLLLAKQGEHGKQISAVHTSVKRMEIITTQTHANNEKRQVLDFFMPTTINPQSNFEHNIRLRHPVTGTWLIESDDLNKWMQTPGSKLWLSGIPGGGKTVLAAAVIQEVVSRASPQTGVAFFFCDYKNEDTWKPLRVLGAIASQLARQNDEAFDMLKAYYDDLHPQKGLEKTADLDELRVTITKITGLFDQVTVVIDGLDECGDQTEDVVDSITETASDSEQLTVALFSRDEIEIRWRLAEEFKCIPIAATNGDIELFVGAEIQQRVQSGRLGMLSTVMKDEIRERLVEGANGMFRWVVCQLDYLGEFATDADRRHALHELPPTLHGSYVRLLERLSGCPKRIQLRVQMCLQFIASKDQRLRTIATLRQAVSEFASTGPPLTETNMVPEREIEYRCSSLIRKSKDGNSFEFAHFSVKEFLESISILENAKLADYHISQHKYTQLLAPQCLKLVHLSNVYEQKNGKPPEIPSGGQEPGDFYGFACCMWPYIIREGLEDPNLVLNSRSLISSRKMRSSKFSTCWKTLFRLVFAEYLHARYLPHSKYAAARESIISRGEPEQWFEDLHLAAALNLPEVCLSLIEAGANSRHQCPYGTPIDLAMRGILAFMPWDSAWTEDEPQSTGWGERYAYQRVINFMVPAASQRNRTIEILLQAGSPLSHDRNPALDLGKESIFSTVAVIACHTKDFTPVTQLLSLGIVPSNSEIDSLEQYLRHWIFETRSDEDSQGRDRSLLELLEYLDSTGAFDSVWGMQMGTIVWSVASAVGSAFTKESNLGSIDTRISLSKDGLVHKAQAAIRRDDCQTLKTCLDDERLDTSQAYVTETDLKTALLELATRYNAVECLQILLRLGFEEDTYYTSGPSPIPLVHVCIDAKAIGSLRILVGHGMSPLAVDSEGMTIFHTCVFEVDEVDINFLGDVLKLDPNATAAGLTMKTMYGYTPLNLLLTGNRGQPDMERMAFELMDWCDKIPGFWSNQHRLFQHAAKFGSAPVIRRLLELGAKPDPLKCSTILRSIRANITLECVRLLKSLCGESACELRAERDNYLPVEMYIMWCMEGARYPNEAIVQELLTPEVHAPKNPKLGTVWGFCCRTIPYWVGRWSKEAKKAYLYGEDRLMTQVPSMLLRLGLMQGYEEACCQSALIPLFQGILDGLGNRWSRRATLYVLPNEPGEIMQLVLNSTKYWSTARKSPTTIRFLKQAIMEGHEELVSVLLRRGVDVHQRQDGISATEFLCQEPAVVTNCATTQGRTMITEVLDKTNREKLNEVKSNRDGLSLLHRVTSRAKPGSAWLISELVKRGVDIEKKCDKGLRETPLLYHLNSGSFDGAQLLVELGANYGNRMQTDKQWDVPQTAAYNGAEKFLRFILAHSANNSVELIWDRPCEVTYKVDKHDIIHEGVTALHLAADGGNVKCLRLFYDERLVKRFEPRTSHGWTPLHCAAWNDSVEAIEFLVSQGAKIDALTMDRSTPLHIAVRMRHLKSTKTLLRLGARNSSDSRSKTPKAYAVGHSNLIACLDKAFGPEIGAMPDKIPWHKIKHLLRGLPSAIDDDSVEECKRMQNLGCPLDRRMPGIFDGDPPLIASLAHGSTQVARWLLENGASTLRIKCNAGGFHVTELATRTEKVTTLLPQILERHHNEGGDLVLGDEYPLHHAVYNKNAVAVKLILHHIEGNHFSIGNRVQMDPDLVKPAIINRLGTLQDYEDVTPLHLAVVNEDIDMISLLVENGAELDVLSESRGSPLASARSVPVAIRLIELGASLGPVYTNDVLFSKLLHHRATKRHTMIPLDEAIFDRVYARHSHIYAPPHPHQMNTALMLSSRGHDLAQDHGVGRSILHGLICDNTLASLVLHNRDFGLDKATPFPWHLSPGRFWFNDFASMAFIGTRFRHFYRLLSTDDFARILNLQPDCGYSPLCWAACINQIDVMKNCLKMGADIDFEGSPYGSALMIACAFGNLDSVKLLVRGGAQTSYVGDNGPVNVMDRTQSVIVRHWLLVGRFNEQKRIMPVKYETSADRRDDICPWSGISKAMLKLAGSFEMLPHESYFDYAKKLAAIRSYMQGRIVQDLVGVDEA